MARVVCRGWNWSYLANYDHGQVIDPTSVLKRGMLCIANIDTIQDAMLDYRGKHRRIAPQRNDKNMGM